MKRNPSILALAALLPLALSACGGGSESAPVTTTPVPVAAVAIQDKAGPAFAAAFNASATASPVDPGANDAGALNLTGQPFDQ